jgi:hypothetical protein
MADDVKIADRVESMLIALEQELPSLLRGVDQDAFWERFGPRAYAIEEECGPDEWPAVHMRIKQMLADYDLVEVEKG